MNNFSITLKHGLSLLFSALLIVMPDISMTLQTQTSSFEIVLFRDKDSLTVYIPGNTAVSIRGLQFETADSSSRRFAYRLEEYSAFYGLNFDAVQAPICLRLLRQGVNLPYPTECMKFPSNQRLTQSLVDADIFWYDPDAGQGILLSVTRSTIPANICSAQQARCPVVVPPAPNIPNGTSASTTPILNYNSDSIIGDIAFVSNRDGAWDIYTMNKDGTNIRRITFDGTYKEQLTWSPDGRFMAFNSNREGNWEIYVLDMTSGKQTNITNNTKVNYQPAWSPDGTKIAFSSSRNGNKDIYTMDPDGKNVVRLTSNSSDNIQPAWSHDGKNIAFVSYRDEGKQRIYVMNATGSNQHRVSKGTDNFAPVWSPNGKQIAFTAGSERLAAVWIINVDGTGLHSLSYEPGFSGFPSWSPDGNYIIFANVPDQKINASKIQIIGVDKSGIRSLTDANAIDAYPTWRP